jgi:hypothetical protein
MSKYIELLRKPPVLEVVDSAREVIVNLVSCMCDNKHKWTIKKNEEGDFKIFTHGSAFSNFQTKFDRDEIEWAADAGDWSDVWKMINSGVSKIESVRSR